MLRASAFIPCPACLLAGILFLAAPHASVTAGHPAATPEDTVRALESARAQALLAADTTALAGMIADDFVEVSRIGQLRTKADNIRELGNGTLVLKTVHYDSLSVRMYGDMAILRGIADNTGTFRGMPFAGKLRYTRVFARRDGRWQAVAMQHTMLP